MSLTTHDRNPRITPSVDRDRNQIGVVRKVTRIVDSFTDEDDRLMLDDVMRITGFPRSTTYRILKQLMEEGWIEHDQRGYRIGAGLSSVASTSVGNANLRSAAAPSLNALHALTGGVTHLSVLDGAMLHYLDKIGGRMAPTIPSRVGARQPANESLSGLVMLSQLPGEEVDRLFAGMVGRAEMDALRLQLIGIRRQKPVFAYAENAGPSGITYAAAPIMFRRKPIGAISVASRGTLPRSQTIPALLRSVGHTTEQLQRAS